MFFTATDGDSVVLLCVGTDGKEKWRQTMSNTGRDRNGGSMALVYLASIVVWIISFFLIRALSRYRELAADRGHIRIDRIFTGIAQRHAVLEA